jgi:hypothetical protein
MWSHLCIASGLQNTRRQHGRQNCRERATSLAILLKFIDAHERAKQRHSRRRGERIDRPHLDAPGTKGAVEFASGIEQHAERRIAKWRVVV